MKYQSLLRLFAALALMSGLTYALVGPAIAAGTVHWSYEGEAGPENWGNLSPDFKLCGTGKAQTPIDIPSSAVVNPADIKFNYQPSAVNILNNGHTIQVNYDPNSSIEVGGKTYNLKQFHFHTPSEHTRDGTHTDLEMHLVHQAADGQLAVVGVMIKKGAENAAFKPVFDNLPAQEQEAKAVPGAMVNSADLLPSTRTYYRYEGSLTTPPCSEGVQWLVMNTPIELSDAQVGAFQAIFKMDARPIQPLNGRSFLMTASMTTPSQTSASDTTAAKSAAPQKLPATGGEGFPIPFALMGLGLLVALAGLFGLRRQAHSA